MTSSSTIETVNMHQAKTELSRLVKDVLSGKRVQIARNGKPVVELRLIEDEIMREPGIMKDQIWVSEDFDDYSADIATLFEGDDRDELSD
jgi:antitoxin (DNA-binding transcriptional repressor) of toxin-antitoxin stability system